MSPILSPARARRRRTLARFPLLFSLVALSSPALADAPLGVTNTLEHEYIAFDPATDSALGAVTLPGGLSAEMQTSSGKITAPDVGRPITEKTPIYGTKPAVADEAFAPDLDTKRPSVLPYDDPFRPSVSPFKRLVAMDAIGSDYRLSVAHPRRIAIDIAREPVVSEPVDPFYLDVALDLVAGEAIRLPTPIAGYAIRKAHLSPAVGFQLLRDGAENLFLIPDGSGHARLAMELATPREAFAGTSKAFGWSDMAMPLIAKIPPKVQKATETAAAELGIDKASMSPSEAVATMVDYFRAFKDSADPPPATSDIFLDLVRGKKGVCRHRAFAMMVLSNGLGIPARLAYNEAHAWVEVHDGLMWRRIDLGGASERLDDKSEKPESPQPRHDPPPDPYAWPPGATRGSDLLPPPSKSSGSGASGGADPPAPASTGTSASSGAPPAKVTLVVPDSKDELIESLRAKKIAVRGRITTGEGAPCKKVRVEVVLKKSGGGGEKMAGALVTDDTGSYDGTVTIPSDLSLGDYTITVHTPGGGACGQGASD